MASKWFTTWYIFQIWNLYSLKLYRNPIRIQLHLNRINRSSDEEVMVKIRSSVPSLEGDRSAQNVETGLSLIRDLRLEGDRSTQNVETGPSLIRDLWQRKRPVYGKRGDRSLCGQNLTVWEGTGLRKTGRPVHSPEFADFVYFWV